MTDPFENQVNEFEAIFALGEAYNACCSTPIVDDDYLEMRHNYETALQNAIKAIVTNRGMKYINNCK